MRNLRKTRKYGSDGAVLEKECLSPNSSYTACVKSFLEERNFNRIPIKGDGNCFYRTIATYMKLAENAAIKVENEKQILRNTVVNKMMTNINEVAPYLANDENAWAQLEALKRDGEWNSDAGDIVTQFAARALNKRLKIYDIKEPVKARKIILSRNASGKEISENFPAQPRKIISYTFEPLENVENTIHMLRVADGHYELLYPKSASIVIKRVKKASITRKASKSPEPVKREPPKRAATRKISISPKPTTRVTRSRAAMKARENSNNERLKKAIEASIENNKLANRLKQLALLEESSNFLNKK